MHRFAPLLALIAAICTPAAACEVDSTEFPSADGLAVTADLYVAHDDPQTPFIVLFHQAGWSRGEYREIAPRLNELGFNCMAVDQRSGGKVNGVRNETAARAAEAGKPGTYPDALPDMLAAIQWARKQHARGQLLIWGSSYSSALVLKIAGDEPQLVDGVLSFAPGEYFQRLGKPADWITQSATHIEVPVFVTSAKKEKSGWWSIYEAIPGEHKAFFLPDTEGNHGSRALWKQFDDSPEYWKAVKAFLEPYRNPAHSESAPQSSGQ